MIGNCQNKELIKKLFGSQNHFAELIEEHGNNFRHGDVVVAYNNGIHTFHWSE